MFHCTQHISFICSFVDGHLSCLHLLAVVNNNAAMNISVQIICLVSFFHFFFWLYTGSRFAGLYGNSVFTFLMNH